MVNKVSSNRDYDDAIVAKESPERQTLLAGHDVFAEEDQAKQNALNSMVDSLSAPFKIETLQSFLASDAAQEDKIEQLVTFLADSPARKTHDELLANTDVFADEQAQQQKALKSLVDHLSNDNASSTVLLATDADAVEAQASFLNVIGGAILLLVAVALVAVIKRSHSKHEAEDERKDFGYKILYE